MAPRTITLTHQLGDLPIAVHPASITEVAPLDAGGATVTLAGSPRFDGEPPIPTTLFVQESEARIRELIREARAS